jgi:hypothetical protein
VRSRAPRRPIPVTSDSPPLLPRGQVRGRCWAGLGSEPKANGPINGIARAFSPAIRSLLLVCSLCLGSKPARYRPPIVSDVAVNKVCRKDAEERSPGTRRVCACTLLKTRERSWGRRSTQSFSDGFLKGWRLSGPTQSTMSGLGVRLHLPPNRARTWPEAGFRAASVGGLGPVSPRLRS